MVAMFSHAVSLCFTNVVIVQLLSPLCKPATSGHKNPVEYPAGPAKDTAPALCTPRSAEQAPPCARLCPENTQMIAWITSRLLVSVLSPLSILLLLFLLLLPLEVEYKGQRASITAHMHRGIAEHDHGNAFVKPPQVAGRTPAVNILPSLVAAFQSEKCHRIQEKVSKQEVGLGCTINRQRVDGAMA